MSLCASVRLSVPVFFPPDDVFLNRLTFGAKYCLVLHCRKTGCHVWGKIGLMSSLSVCLNNQQNRCTCFGSGSFRGLLLLRSSLRHTDFFKQLYRLIGISPLVNSGCYLRGKPAAIESRYPTLLHYYIMDISVFP